MEKELKSSPGSKKRTQCDYNMSFKLAAISQKAIISKVFDSIDISDDVKKFIDHSFDVVDQIHIVLDQQNKTQRNLAKMLGKKESKIRK